MDRENSNSPCNVIFIGPQQTPRAVRFVDASVSVLVRVREDGRKYAAAWSNEEGGVKERGGEGRCFRNFYARVLRFSGADHWKISRGRRCVKTVDPAWMDPSFAAVAAIPIDLPNRSACHLWRVESHVGRPILKKCRRMSVPLL